MRDLVEVINYILYCIPNEETELIHVLKKVKSSVYFTAPELMYMRWNEVYNILCLYVFTDDKLDGWKECVRKIFIGEA